MLSLALIGFFGGLITGISPCILPVLPVIFFSGGVQGARNTTDVAADAPPPPAPSRWRPFLVIGGLVVSFSIFTLVGSLILTLLHLPQDVLRWAGLIVLILIGIGLIIPKFEAILEKPFSWIPQRNVGTERGGFLLGLALGAVYVPCAGPVLAAITVAGSTGKIGPETVVLTVTFAFGAAIPLLVFALAGRRVAERVKAFRQHQRGIRITGGIVMIALAIGLVYNVPAALQALIPDYTSSLQNQFSNSKQVTQALDLGGLVTDENKNLSKCTPGATELESCGIAPPLAGIQQWFNTPNDAPISLAQESGKVVLVDFWAYSCINCQRSIPHLVAWNKAYKNLGLEIIGVHAPEYAFEKVPANVMAGAKDFGITYPVALDNNLATWTNYRNQYWPAHYLIDTSGTVRNIQFGEGNYSSTEKLIRELLVQANPSVKLPPATEVADATPTEATTPETFLGTTKQVNYGGSEKYSTLTTAFTVPSKLPKNSFALDGKWTLGTQSITPTDAAAQVVLNYSARDVMMVLSGTGTVSYTTGGVTKTFDVTGTPNAYPLLSTKDVGSGTLTVTLSPGLTAYSFTFG
ncbi:cytochrome c biogenesis protein CcdA [Glaciibacter psychrotolerans]|uniref:Cytochrome c biogenesis protein CcdA/thiol-disulfide isomerase/thioredoxin n=1 Tax=Glaciibacter psychrotolerans TaxID=670054 RepID=A0A7Z0EGU1_9MICO|nr:cytochrome c biogenesis protein CcdA/thiol-disulfide isomerase/thioredoxin [Leifsonia psychrotolerans]